MNVLLCIVIFPFVISKSTKLPRSHNIVCNPVDILSETRIKFLPSNAVRSHSPSPANRFEIWNLVPHLGWFPVPYFYYRWSVECFFIFSIVPTTYTSNLIAWSLHLSPAICPFWSYIDFSFHSYSDLSWSHLSVQTPIIAVCTTFLGVPLLNTTPFKKLLLDTVGLPLQ